MQTLLNFLMFFLLYSFLHLSNPTNLTEARNLISHHPFKADLIRRTSPLSPYYDSQMTPQQRQWRDSLGSVSLGHKIRLSSVYYDEKIAMTDVIPNGGDYLMKISIGTPPVELTAVVDTGSDLFWLQCTPCQRCIKNGSTSFDPTKSSSYHIVPCNSQSCYYQDFDSGCIPQYANQNKSCVYSAIYGDGTESIGVLSTETISFPSSEATYPTFPGSIFGCGYDQRGHLGLHGDGIIGLGLGSLSLTSQLGSQINYKFSYCLTPLSSNVTGKLTFGLGITRPGVVSSPFTIQDPPTFYTLTLDSIKVGNNTFPLGGQDMIIDSGTTLTFVPTSIYDSVKTAVKGAIELTPVPDPNKAFDPCYEAGPTGGDFSPPDVVFQFKGADVVLKAVNTFRKVKNLTCLAIVPSDDSLLFGNVAQVNFEVLYDLKAKQISFAPADCTKY